MLSLDETVDYFARHFTRTAFRLETLDRYDVESDGDEYRRYLAGEDPEPGFKDQWLQLLRDEKAAGKRRHRVHVLRTPLNDYLRYECEWGYAPNVAAGEDIRILDLSETPRPDEVPSEEFWLLDDAHVIVMHYDDGGAFIGGEPVDDPIPYRAARDAAIAASEDFTTWWARHPEEWRTNRMAA